MLKAENISKSFIDRSSGKSFRLLQDVSLEIAPGEAVALMGVSGSGKSTLARLLLRLLPCDAGKIYFRGTEITELSGKELAGFRRSVQFISQRPESFLDPRKTLSYSLREALEVFSLPYVEEQALEMLDLVKLNAKLLERYPHQVSGGEIQRICLVRALLLEPELLILDEPTSMLDISVQAQILHLLKDIRTQKQIAYLFISHDRLISEWLCDRVVRIEQGLIRS
ncbi:ABC transporter ATP-binding protein [uncultured Phascolarctobacterium sp.]|uniref:ABC transporter ATP-binding protein n=1 Tax=uncultured Phascolarctobacterium sp. TaxID=512296 RepID=UPI0025E188B1|nr:ATP-binding cassette domain-containing protein [uncultured Phascolarctobacterium sp.]